MTQDKAKFFLFFSITLMAGVLSSRSFAGTEGTVMVQDTAQKMQAFVKQGHLALQAGGYWRTNASPQFIHIDGLVGDKFTINNSYNANGLFGVGYYIDGHSFKQFDFSYGLNWFYLPKTSVAGTVLQENLYPNLSYAYNVTQYPLYVMAKSTLATKFSGLRGTMNVGIGPNFMTTGHFTERSNLTGDVVAVPDNLFSGKTTTTFSVTAGAGLQWDNFVGTVPLACGYQFYYLGQGGFNVTNNQVQNPLKTGTLYANAVTCAVFI